MDRVCLLVWGGGAVSYVIASWGGASPQGHLVAGYASQFRVLGIEVAHPNGWRSGSEKKLLM